MMDSTPPPAVTIVLPCAAKIVAIDDRTFTISITNRLGGGNAARSQRIAMVEASRLTQERGFRYFVITDKSPADPREPGAYTITIRVYHDGDIDPKDPQVWDPERILSAK